MSTTSTQAAKTPVSHVEVFQDAEKVVGVEIEGKAQDELQIESFTAKEESKLVLKQDLIILPLLSLALFFGYLDRGNIGNARILGMQEDLHLTSQQYYNIVMMFFLGYMVIELPAGMALRYFHPRWVFGTAAIVFGVAAASAGKARNYATLMGLRVLIGLAEAFVNNAYIFVSLWYKHSELALRTALVYSLTPVAGAFSGIISYGVGKTLEGASDIRAWQWLFIIEGVITVGMGFVLMALLPGLPEIVSQKGHFPGFRDPRQRRLILARLRSSQNSEGAKFRWQQVLLALRDPKIYLGAAMVGCQGIGIGAFGVFLPTFINEFGFGALETQLYSMIPYAFGLAGLLAGSWLADHLGRKAGMILVCLATTITGFIILLSTTNKVALLAGACFVTTGAYPGLAIGVAWHLSCHGGYTKRAMCIWICQIFVQSYSIISTQTYRDPPRFFLGHGVSVGLYCVGAVCTVVLHQICKTANAAKTRRAQEFEADGVDDPLTSKDLEELCDYHPKYMYAL